MAALDCGDEYSPRKPAALGGSVDHSVVRDDDLRRPDLRLRSRRSGASVPPARVGSRDDVRDGDGSFDSAFVIDDGTQVWALWSARPARHPDAAVRGWQYAHIDQLSEIRDLRCQRCLVHRIEGDARRSAPQYRRTALRAPDIVICSSAPRGPWNR